MAQIDTGLGWMAFDNWLVQAGSAHIAEYLNISGGLRIPQCAKTAADIMANGVYVGTVYDYNWNRYEDHYLACEPGTDAICFWTQDGWLAVGALTGNKAIYNLTWDTTHDSLRGIGELLTPEQANRGNYHATQWAFSWSIDHLNPDLPVYSDMTTGWNSISTTSAPFTKTNAGYAVACLASWNTGSATIKTPILISSVSAYTDMDKPAGTSYNIAKLNVMYEGMRFYMSFFDITDNPPLNTLVPIVDLTEEGSKTLNDIFDFIAEYEQANIVVGQKPDPYETESGESEPGGADGEEDTSDDVDFTDPPSTSIGATGFLTIFCPSLAELQSLATFMWGSFDVDNWRKLFANPMDAILGLHIIPVPAHITGTKAVKVGGIDTTIDMSYTTVRYIRRPMGTCDIPKKWGAYLDYNPYTKISIFLPFIGFKDLDADDVMGKTLSLQYIIDILTGACVAELKCEDTVLYSWQGNCANEVPISGSDWRGAISSAIGIAGAIATTALTHGASAPMIAGTVASVGANSLNLKPSVSRSGSIAGSAGFISHLRPYIIRTVPNVTIPADQHKFIGYPSYTTVSLGSLIGYNVVDSIHLENIPATTDEITELETILKGGVIY